MKRVLAIAVCCAALWAPAQAADSQGQFGIKGAGRAPCSVFIEAREQETKQYFLFGGWIEGYLTATNMHLSQTYDVAPWQSTELLAALVDSNCRRNPDEPFSHMVRVVANSLEEHKLASRSPMQKIDTGEQPIVLPQATIRAVQEKLKQFGLYDGGLDGQFGPNTKRAIANFQDKVQELQTTGYPDQATLLYLLLGQPRQG